ncbi:aminoglycoside phosphotransferase family protein [Streptomyces bohaiensis]|uniref:aminoglycoside phosphotransferase family protein n=1 Tax=Streptomyces bohaiensis TaxID=1431344 RepID=UPI003B783654
MTGYGFDLRIPDRLHEAQKRFAPPWLELLPGRVAQLAAAWGLTPERVVTPGSRCSLVLLVRTTTGAPLTLKLVAPGDAAEREAEVLGLWQGHGAVRLVRHDGALGALLLERARPEVSLRSLPEARAVLETLSVAQRLWQEPPSRHALPDVAGVTASQAARMRSTAAEEPELAGAVDEALAARQGLLAEAADGPRVLHGDLRQGAVIASASDRAPWLAVGPHPLVGERAYDLARAVRDRLHDLVASSGSAAVTRRRVRSLADATEVDADRLRAWASFRAVESAARSVREGRRRDAEALLEFTTWL